MRVLKRLMVWYPVGAMFMIATAPRCLAGFSSSAVIALSPADRPADLAELVKSRNSIEFAIPAKAGIHLFQHVLDPGFRRGDDPRDFLRDHRS